MIVSTVNLIVKVCVILIMGTPCKILRCLKSIGGGDRTFKLRLSGQTRVVTLHKNVLVAFNLEVSGKILKLGGDTTLNSKKKHVSNSNSCLGWNLFNMF